MSDWNKCDWRIANGSVQPHQSELQIDSTSNSIKWSVYCENAQRSIEWVQAVGAPEMLVYRTTVKMLPIYWYRLHRKYRIGFTNYYAQFSCIGFLGQKHDRIFSSAKWIVERIRGWVCNLSIAFIIFCGKRMILLGYQFDWVICKYEAIRYQLYSMAIFWTHAYNVVLHSLVDFIENVTIDHVVHINWMCTLCATVFNLRSLFINIQNIEIILMKFGSYVIQCKICKLTTKRATINPDRQKTSSQSLVSRFHSN